MKPMRLIYIYHSGFIIESKEFAILIDYYRDTQEFYVHRHFLKRPGRLYILSSHAHPDHFNPEILLETGKTGHPVYPVRRYPRQPKGVFSRCHFPKKRRRMER